MFWTSVSLYYASSSYLCIPRPSAKIFISCAVLADLHVLSLEVSIPIPDLSSAFLSVSVVSVHIFPCSQLLCFLCLFCTSGRSLSLIPVSSSPSVCIPQALESLMSLLLCRFLIQSGCSPLILVAFLAPGWGKFSMKKNHQRPAKDLSIKF